MSLHSCESLHPRLLVPDSFVGSLLTHPRSKKLKLISFVSPSSKLEKLEINEAIMGIFKPKDFYFSWPRISF